MTLVSGLWWRVESSDNTTARSGQLKVLNDERKVAIVGVKDEETMEDVLLDALGVVTRWNQWTFFTDSIALFDSHVLIKLVAVGLDMVYNNAPFSLSVDGSHRLDVVDRTGAQVSLFDQFVKGIDRVGSVNSDILIEKIIFKY